MWPDENRGTMDPSIKYTAARTTYEEASEITYGTQKTKKRESILLAWWQETLAVLIAIGTMAAIVKLLLFYDGKELPRWKGNMSLNAVASFMIVLQRGTLMVVIVEVISNTKWSWFRRRRPLNQLETIDEASRTVLGAFRLIFCVPTNFLGVVAALVTILSFGMGPLTQQAVQSVPCQQIISNGTRASIPVAQSVPRMFYRYGAGLFALEAPVVGKMFSGLTNPNGADWRLDADCSTGNCQFSAKYGITHSTMGLCSSCIDVTSKVQAQTNESSPTAFLPNGQNITGSALQHWLSVKYESSKQDWTRGISAEYDAIAPSAFSKFTVLSFTLDGCNATSNSSSDAWRKSTCSPGFLSNSGYTLNAVASSCSVYSCVKNLYGTVSNGVLQETLISTVSAPSFNLSRIADNITIINSPCITSDQTVYTSSNLTKLPPNAPNTQAILVDGKNVSVPTTCLYRMYGLHARAFDLFFQSYFTNSCWYYDQAGRIDSLVCETNWHTSTFFAGGFASPATISAAVARLTDAATNTFRLAGKTWDDEKPARVEGDVLRTTVCARVEMKWLTGPIVVVALTAVLLAMVIAVGIVENRTEGHVPVWKSSLLPLLWHGLARADGEPNDENPLTVKELRRRAEEIEVRFGMGETHWGLVKEE